MIGSLFKKVKELRSNKQFLAIGIGAVAVVLVVVGLILGGNNKHDVAKTAMSHAASSVLSPSHSAEASAGPNAKTAASDKKNQSAATSGASPTSTVLKTTTNSDGTTTKQIATTKSIPYSTQTQNEVNLKRGTTRVQPGQNGVETIVIAVTYDKDGNEISRKTLSDTVTSQAVAQITKIGMSDFNLNTDTWDGTAFGEMCLPTDYDSAGDGCVGVPSDRHIGIVVLSGTNYVRCVSDTSGVCNSGVNVQPVIAVRGDNTFSYQGTTYRADIRAGGGVSQLLTPSLCSEYGLVCGSW